MRFIIVAIDLIGGLPKNSKLPAISRLEPKDIDKIVEHDLEEQFIVVATSQIFNSFQSINASALNSRSIIFTPFFYFSQNSAQSDIKPFLFSR